jgi:hypothetical protein
LLFQLSSGRSGYGNYGFLASGMLMLIGVDVDFQRQFRAACGYAELGMTTESIAELNVIDDEHQGRPEVLQLRLHHLMRKKQWTRALTIYYYNMGCYEVLLGNLKDARVHLQISFKMDSSFRDLAKRDPDLKPLHSTL